MASGPGQASGHELSGRQRLAFLATTVAGHTVKHVFNSGFFVVLPEIKAGLELTNVQVGVLSMVKNIVGGAANIPAGFLADRYAHRREIILAATLFVIGGFSLLLGFATNYWWALLATSVMVGAISFWHPAAIASLSTIFAQRRGFALSLHGTGASIGEAVGPVLAGALLSFLFWRTVLQGSVIPAVMVGVAVWLIIRSLPRPKAASFSMREYLSGAIGLFRNRRLLLLMAIVGGFAGGQSVLVTFMPIYLREDLALSSLTVGLYLSLAQAAGIGTQPIMGYLSDRAGRKAVLAPTMTILAAGYTSLYYVPAGWPFVLVLVVSGAFVFSLASIIIAAAMDVVDESVRSITVSFVYAAMVVVAGLAPAIGGFVADAHGTHTTFILAGATVAVAAVLTWVSPWQARSGP